MPGCTDGDPLIGQALCADCYDYTGHVLFNALASELWRRFTITVPRQLARLTGLTRTLPFVDADLRRIVRFGTQTDARSISRASGLPATGTDLPAPAVANYIAKYATKATSTPGLPDRPVRSPAVITKLRCPAHHKRLITTYWQLGKDPAAAQPALNRWTHMLGYRGHFLTNPAPTPSPLLSCASGAPTTAARSAIPTAKPTHGGRPLDERLVLVDATWIYAGTGHATTGQHALALAAAARAREHEQAAREYARTA